MTAGSANSAKKATQIRIKLENIPAPKPTNHYFIVWTKFPTLEVKEAQRCVPALPHLVQSRLSPDPNCYWINFRLERVITNPAFVHPPHFAGRLYPQGTFQGVVDSRSFNPAVREEQEFLRYLPSLLASNRPLVVFIRSHSEAKKPEYKKKLTIKGYFKFKYLNFMR